jgi:hypothetical protein
VNTEEIMEHIGSEVLRNFETLVGIPRQKLYVAGGAIASLYHGEPVKDYDIFSREPVTPGPGLAPSCVTPRAWTWVHEGTCYQLIKSWIGPPSQVVMNFDLSCCRSWADPYGSETCCLHSAMTAKKVMVCRTGTPVETLGRLAKYLQKGYQLPGLWQLTSLVGAIKDEPRGTAADLLPRLCRES